MIAKLLYRSHRPWEKLMLQHLQTIGYGVKRRVPGVRYTWPIGLHPYVKARCYRKKRLPDMSALFAEWLLTR